MNAHTHMVPKLSYHLWSHTYHNSTIGPNCSFNLSFFSPKLEDEAGTKACLFPDMIHCIGSIVGSISSCSYSVLSERMSFGRLNLLGLTFGPLGLGRRLVTKIYSSYICPTLLGSFCLKATRAFLLYQS